jgi:hypothetical protein
MRVKALEDSAETSSRLVDLAQDFEGVVSLLLD